MRTRVGIELTPVASRIVEVVHRGRVWRTPGSGSSVVSFGMCPASEPDLGDALQSLRGKAASVVVWGTASEHRQVDVHIGSYERMRAEALRTLSDDGVPPARELAWGFLHDDGSRRPRRRDEIAARLSMTNEMKNHVSPRFPGA